jgi:CRP-like cAMP-binding protein/thioredoxin reductase/Fe-S-cluster-containing hydrogenase component 2
MADQFDVAVIGAGPGGLGAATNAAFRGLSHVLFEKSEIGNTIFDYQLRKHVMAEPSRLPLRSKVGFDAGSRESILGVWNAAIAEHKVNVRKAEVSAIKKGEDGLFRIEYGSEHCFAKNVVLAIGMQGSPRKLGVPGEDLPHVAYTLSDPDEFKDKDIIVVGAGDAAIENAMALSEANRVSIINRSGEFPRAKDANAAAITGAIKAGKIRGFYNAAISRVEDGTTYVNTPDGEVAVPCTRIIARLGAIMPRDFLEKKCSLTFTSADAEAIPVVDKYYQSPIKGLYVVGALIGYPLIKQAINQGYEVIEHVVGNEVEPADQVLIKESLAQIPGDTNANLAMIREALPLFEECSDPQFRELVIESKVHKFKPGAVVFKVNDYTDSIYSVVNGSVAVQLPGNRKFIIRAGAFFGEMSLLSGRRRSATILMEDEGVLLETPRKQILKLINSVPSVKKKIDNHFMRRVLETKIFPEVDPVFINDLVEKATTKNFRKGDALVKEGEIGDVLYVIRKGSVKVSRRDDSGNDIPQTYLPAGNYVGEMALLSEEDLPRTATVSAAVPVETIIIQKSDFRALLTKSPELERRVKKMSEEKAIENMTAQRDAKSAGMLDFMVSQGVTDAENVLVIDSDLCIGCDNCEAACAATHGGYSRLDRKGGTSFASIQVPISCRHCENPLCMLDCPPDALTRMPNGEVVIRDSCIGCGNCVRNCPYGVIQMVYDKPKGISALLQALGLKKKEKGAAKAGKCDMCRTLPGGPSCVRSCPTGAALRLNPAQLLARISSKQV